MFVYSEVRGGDREEGGGKREEGSEERGGEGRRISSFYSV